MSSFAQLVHQSYGQSLWYDHIRRSELHSGAFAKRIEQGIRGCTSNPTIFNQAIGGSADYDDVLLDLTRSGCSVEDIYYALVRQDITHAADLLKPVYESSKGTDGFVSVEVQPRFANDPNKTIEEAEQLHKEIGRNNVMIKVPGTEAGLIAIRELTARGIPLNVTLIFSLEQYKQVVEAYLSGLERARSSGYELRKIASVASFFISRIDTKVDAQLLERSETRKMPGSVDPLSLLGKIAIANAKCAFQYAQQVFRGPRFAEFSQAGAQPQRLLWASTGTKNPQYPDTLYVDQLIGPNTVNTLPPATFDACLDHGKLSSSLCEAPEEAKQQLEQLIDLDIDLNAICQQLLNDGVRSFYDALETLFETLTSRRDSIAGSYPERHNYFLGSHRHLCDDALQQLHARNTLASIWKREPQAFRCPTSHHQSILNRLGWLDAPAKMRGHIEDLHAFHQSVCADGFRQVLLLGMGGSSLCPEVLSDIFGKTSASLELRILDNTDPVAVSEAGKWVAQAKTLFIASSKSGRTIETNRFLEHFWNLAQQQDPSSPSLGERFVAITDPGTPLSELAKTRNFRRVFENPSDIGGRYSALSFFGLVPAALLGIDLERFLSFAESMVSACTPDHSPFYNPGLRLGAWMAEFASQQRNKLTIFASPRYQCLGAWIEQLVAESTGKDGQGIIPVDREPWLHPKHYDEDRLFVCLRDLSNPSDTLQQHIEQIRSAGFPIAIFDLNDPLEVAGEFYRWEMGTSIAASLMGINPFDEPNVTEAKEATQSILQHWKNEGQLPACGVQAANANNPSILHHLQLCRPGDYIVLSAYFFQSQQSLSLLHEIRQAIGSTFNRPTTLGVGPRFLHSTGQLHKGGPNTGVFLVLTESSNLKLDIDESEQRDLATLRDAQLLGDLQVLHQRGRRLLKIDLGSNVEVGLQQLLDLIKSQDKKN